MNVEVIGAGLDLEMPFQIKYDPVRGWLYGSVECSLLAFDVVSRVSKPCDGSNQGNPIQSVDKVTMLGLVRREKKTPLV